MGILSVFKDRRELRARVAALEVEKRGLETKLVALADEYDALLESRERVHKENSSLIAMNARLEAEVQRFMEGPIMFTRAEINARCDAIESGEIDLVGMLREAEPVRFEANIVVFPGKGPEEPVERDGVEDERSPELMAAITAVRLDGGHGWPVPGDPDRRYSRDPDAE